MRLDIGDRAVYCYTGPDLACHMGQHNGEEVAVLYAGDDREPLLVGFPNATHWVERANLIPLDITARP